jgi:hypothetical protein
MGRMSAEARARLAGEAELIRRHRAEFERLLKSKKTRNAAIVALVDKYKIEYGERVKIHRDRFQVETAA